MLKAFEETVTGTLGELAGRFAETPPKGEIAIVVGPPGAPAPSQAAVPLATSQTVLALAELSDGSWWQHGVEVAEDAAPGQHSFMNHHFPASDIPAQARALYTCNPLRLIADVDARPVPRNKGTQPVTFCIFAADERISPVLMSQPSRPLQEVAPRRRSNSPIKRATLP